MINIVSNSKFKNVTFSGFLYLGFLLVLLMSYYLILYKNPYTIDYSIGNLFYLPHILIASCTILFHGLNFLFYQIKYKITTIDLGVYSWIMTVLISRLHVIHDEPFFNDVTSNLLIASCFYFIIRQIANEILLKF